MEVAALAGVPEAVTSRAKVILKNLEKNDLTVRPHTEEAEDDYEPGLNLSAELAEIDVNALTPMQALALIAEWKEKVK